MLDLNCPEAPVGQRAADVRAARHWAANLRALSLTQPRLADPIQSVAAEVRWIFGRDGYLTAQQGDAWWSGCSAPLRAAQYMMRTLDVNGSMACLLQPVHAGQIRAVLDLLQRPQALIVLSPDVQSLRVLLACDDFSEPIGLHRLWFAWGPAWDAELQQLLEENPGLPTPTQFVRPIAADYTTIDPMVAPAQRIFADIQSRRQSAIQSIVRVPSAPKKQLCVVAGSHFRLWDDAGAVLAESLAGCAGSCESSLVRFDPDDPASASPLALAEAAGDCEALFAANIGRGDLPEVARKGLPWITWVTGGRIPSGAARGPRDALLIADERFRQAALAAGWPAQTIAFSPWPIVSRSESQPSSRSSTLALIADIPSSCPPAQVAEFSSHALLWESIADELENHPFALNNVEAYLDERMRRVQIAPDGFNRALFIERLILPSYQRGLARLLTRSGMNVRCHGIGWSDFEPGPTAPALPIRSRSELIEAANTSAALVHCWPADGAHPIEALGRPVVRAFGSSRDAFLKMAHAALAGSHPAQPSACSTVLSEAAIRLLAESKLRVIL